MYTLNQYFAIFIKIQNKAVAAIPADLAAKGKL
jgi:hypothetical protein